MNIHNIKEYIHKREEILNLLNQLTSCYVFSKDRFEDIIYSLNSNHNIYVYVENDKIIGIITLLIEQKLIHNGSCVAHIEDLVVDKNYQNRGVARKLVDFCLSKLSTDKHYKIILDCSIQFKEFYEKLGFENKNIQMSKYLI